MSMLPQHVCSACGEFWGTCLNATVPGLNPHDLGDLRPCMPTQMEHDLRQRICLLEVRLHELCAAVTDYMPNGYPGPKRKVVLDKMQAAREALQ